MAKRSVRVARGVAGLLLGLLVLGASGLARADSVTVLFDAFGRERAGLVRAWGFAALVEVRGKTILFDTGGDSRVFQGNVRALNIDLRRVDMIVNSHSHDDHVAGLNHARTLAPSALLVAPDDQSFGARTMGHAPSWLHSTAARELGADERYYRGDAKHPILVEHRYSDLNAQIVGQPHRELAPGIHVVRTVSERFGTYRPVHGDPQKRAFSGLRELSLVVETSRGLAVIVGCSHAGIDEVLRAVRAAFPRKPIAFLLGGFHLLEDQPSSVEATVLRLRDEHKVGTIAPAHCTSELGFLGIRKHFGRNYRFAGLGERIAIPR